MSFSRGARSATQPESLAAALARPSPRTSTRTGLAGSGGSGPACAATEHFSSSQDTRIVTLTSPASPWSARYVEMAAAAAPSRRARKNGPPCSARLLAGGVGSMARMVAAVRSTWVDHSKSLPWCVRAVVYAANGVLASHSLDVRWLGSAPVSIATANGADFAVPSTAILAVVVIARAVSEVDRMRARRIGRRVGRCGFRRAPSRWPRFFCLVARCAAVTRGNGATSAARGEPCALTACCAGSGELWLQRRL
mmetsp:Transcript_6808/g.21459  ORF Transcript_6808/g.21459 Transcript_6808/m.21459 type:complete len:252 (+) Transcript_6808:485-1240(+)